ncbi:MAG: MarR family winged helix-turn-helix transcriptional regulator [Oscillospiraceae bacterium]|nr:MarR family winged helix-turn-helix transcriptional regulator [Oscillospiraceae bacterium]MDY3065369.1 MarR family winged helix-turn-helix transcriptional regulator [Oscillospiraceae bacterium]
MKGQCDALLEALHAFLNTPLFEEVSSLFKGENRILHYLYQEQRNDVTPSELSEQLHVTRARVTAAVKELQKKEYVQAVHPKTDRRRVYLMLTPPGTSYIVERIHSVQQCIETLQKGLGETDVLEIVRLLMRSFRVFETAAV